MKKYSLEIKWGVIFSVAILLWVGFERLIGLHGENVELHSSVTNFFAIPAIAVYLFALLDKRKTDYDGVMSWREGFMTGVFITLVVVVLNPIVQSITHLLISPDFLTNLIEFTTETGRMDQAEAEEYFNLRNYITLGIVGSLFMGLATSAVVAIFTRKRGDD